MQIEQLDWAGLRRRRFLRAALAGVGAAAALPLALGIGGCARDGAALGRLLVLSPTQARVLAAAAEAVAPPQSGFPSIAEARVVERLDEELWFADASVQDDLRAALSVMEWLPVAYGRFSRFSTLERGAREAFLLECMSSRIETVRAIGTNLRLLTMFFYFGHASAWPAMGYDGPFQKLPPLVSEQRKLYADTVAGRAS